MFLSPQLCRCSVERELHATREQPSLKRDIHGHNPHRSRPPLAAAPTIGRRWFERRIPSGVRVVQSDWERRQPARVVEPRATRDLTAARAGILDRRAQLRSACRRAGRLRSPQPHRRRDAGGARRPRGFGVRSDYLPDEARCAFPRSSSPAPTISWMHVRASRALGRRLGRRSGQPRRCRTHQCRGRAHGPWPEGLSIFSACAVSAEHVLAPRRPRSAACALGELDATNLNLRSTTSRLRPLRQRLGQAQCDRCGGKQLDEEAWYVKS